MKDKGKTVEIAAAKRYMQKAMKQDVGLQKTIKDKGKTVDTASVQRYMQKAIEEKGANINIATVKQYVQKSMKDRGMKPPSSGWPGWRGWGCYWRCYIKFKVCIYYCHPWYPKKQDFDISAVKRYMKKAIEEKGINVNMATVKQYVQKSMKDRGMKPPSSGWPGWRGWWCYMCCFIKYINCISHCHYQGPHRPISGLKKLDRVQATSKR